MLLLKYLFSASEDVGADNDAKEDVEADNDAKEVSSIIGMIVSYWTASDESKYF